MKKNKDVYVEVKVRFRKNEIRRMRFLQEICNPKTGKFEPCALSLDELIRLTIADAIGLD